MKIILYGVGIILLTVAGYGAYYFISPYFIQVQLDEPMPQLIEPARVPTEMSADSDQSVVTITTNDTDVMEEESELVAGDSIGVDVIPKSKETIPTLPLTSTSPVPVIGAPGHKASGTVRLLQTIDGPVIRYENFSTINGPDLYVYLAADLDASDYVSLGRLKATEGNINYAVPADIDIAKYPYVMVWCQQFGVLFNSARIQ